MGEKRAQSIIEEVFTDDEKDDENIHIRIGIEKQDIAEELLNNSLLRVSKMQQTTIEEIRKILAEGYEQGESWKEQKKRIENKIKNPVRAEMIAITELGHAYNTSTKNTYKGAVSPLLKRQKSCPLCVRACWASQAILCCWAWMGRTGSGEVSMCLLALVFITSLVSKRS